eukprot:COSAG01_NODE_16477_length_1233_cov_1.834215_1_plen_109_part_00
MPIDVSIYVRRIASTGATAATPLCCAGVYCSSSSLRAFVAALAVDASSNQMDCKCLKCCQLGDGAADNVLYRRKNNSNFALINARGASCSDESCWDDAVVGGEKMDGM